MTRRLRRAIASALGVTTICCLWIVGPLVGPSHNTIYHWSGPASTIFIPSALDFISFWILFSFLMFLAQGEKRSSRTLLAGIVLLLPWAALKSGALLTNSALPHWISRSLFGLCTGSFFLVCVYLLPDHRVALERLRKHIIDALCIVATSGVVILVQLAWFGWQARHLNAPLQLHLNSNFTTQTKTSRPRIVWILLDELSYQQVYGHRFHTLSLPAFDRLAQQSSVFTDVAPAGMMTEIVMPSLITGLPVDQIQPSSNGLGLKIHNPVTGQWRAFDQHDTIFSDAITSGYSTAIAGWYNPYCRILPEVLDQCSWVSGQLVTDKMLPRASIVGNMLNPFLLSLNAGIIDHLPSAITHGNKAEQLAAKTHISDYQQISDSADQLLQKSAFDFIFIHMAIPHPSGIYNRRTRTLVTRNATYIDNLALADLYLAHVHSVLEAEGQWDSSAIIIMGDHSWRTERWVDAPDWTSEEEEASNGGQFDDRPGYIVKLPEQQVGTRINAPFAAVYTRRLFTAIMRKQIVSPEDLSEWIGKLDKERSPE
jgi:hypothetical protein